jgi:hypothetical protein
MSKRLIGGDYPAHNMAISVPLLAFIAFVILADMTLPVRAEMGPCKQDEKRDVLICGNGAAIVIRNTLSPSQRLGLAWRTPDAPPTEEPDWDKIELLVLRVADGAVLSRGKTEYWDTGEGYGHVNRLEELAYWSPNSRLMIRSFNSRYSTDNVELYAFDPDDKVTGPLDLLKIIDSAARAKLKARVKNADGYDFSLTSIKDEETPATIDDRGLIRAEVMYWIPKMGPYYYYTVKARVMRAKGALEARIVSIAYRGKQEE